MAHNKKTPEVIETPITPQALDVIDTLRNKKLWTKKSKTSDVSPPTSDVVMKAVKRQERLDILSRARAARAEHLQARKIIRDIEIAKALSKITGPSEDEPTKSPTVDEPPVWLARLRKF